jgi:hypothetical protein
VTRAVLPLAVAVLACACGYAPLIGRVPGGGDRVSIPVAQNRTPYDGLAGPLTSALRQKLAVSGVEVEPTGGSAPALEVRILRVELSPGMLGVSGGRLVPLESVSRIEAEASLVRSDGAVLEGPVQVSAEGRSLAGGNVSAEESLAARGRLYLMDDLANAVVAAIFEERAR